MLTFMLALACTAALKDDIADLEAELEELESQVEELEDGDGDTAAPVDTGDTESDSEEPFEVPTVRYFYSYTGTHPNYTYTSTVEITGDYDAKRVGIYANGAYDEPDEDCIEYVGPANLSIIFVEFWYNGHYDCWALQGPSYPHCNQIPYNVAELSCD